MSTNLNIYVGMGFAVDEQHPCFTKIQKMYDEGNDRQENVIIIANEDCNVFGVFSRSNLIEWKDAARSIWSYQNLDVGDLTTATVEINDFFRGLGIENFLVPCEILTMYSLY